MFNKIIGGAALVAAVGAGLAMSSSARADCNNGNGGSYGGGYGGGYSGYQQPVYQPGYQQPTYQPAYQPSYQPAYQPTYQPVYQPVYQPQVIVRQVPAWCPPPVYYGRSYYRQPGCGWERSRNDGFQVRINLR